MSNFVEQSHVLGQNRLLLMYSITRNRLLWENLQFISYDDVTTMFHEFGRSIHGMFADQKYTTLSGTNVPHVTL